MEYGIALASTLDGWKTVKRAEELGFTHAWFYDSQLLAPDVFVAMALAAEHTSKIKLATGVLVPSNRIAPVTASALASLNKLAPGRIVFGVGTGFTARNTMGLAPIRLADLREHLRVVRGLLAGETLEWEFEGQRRKIRLLNPEFGLIDIGHRIPLHISAFAPKARRLTAEIADGWITFMSAVPRALHELEQVDSTCRDLGRDPASLCKTAFALGCVLADGESYVSARARAQAGPLATVFLHAQVSAGNLIQLPPEIRPVVEEYRKQYATYEPADARYLTMHKLHLLAVRPEEERFLTPDLIRMATFTATCAELRERLRALDGGGYDQFVIQLVAGHESALEDWANLFGLV
jgi:5,10-methylenetetrahydromethanopterin reductase